MKPLITHPETGAVLWTTADCAAHCGITESSWRSYVRRRMPPERVGHINARTPLWFADEVKAWHAARPGSPVPNAPTSSRS